MSEVELIIFGAGGHGREIFQLALACGWSPEQLAFVVSDQSFFPKADVGAAVYTLEQVLDDREARRFVVALGSGEQRKRYTAQFLARNWSPEILIHPGAAMSANVRIAPGCVVCAGTILTTDIDLGPYVHVNIGCSVSHDVRIAPFATISPGVRIAGNVHIGEGAFIGIGAIVLPGKVGRPLRIGEGSIVGAGAVVTRDVPAESVVVGVPARVVRQLGLCK